MSFPLPRRVKFKWRSPIAIGLGLCFIAGCAMGTTGRFPSVADRGGWLRRPAAESHPGPRTESSPGVEFRAPERNKITTEHFDQESSFAGHLPDQMPDEQDRPKADVGGGSVTNATYAEPSKNETSQADWTAESPSDNVKVVDAHYRSDRDGSTNPIQLQGLQVDDSEATEELPLWAHRPVTTQVKRPDIGWQRDGYERTPDEGVQPAGLRLGMGSRVGDHQPDNLAVASMAKAGPPGPWQVELERLIARAERDLVAMTPGTTPASQADYRRQQVHLRLLYLMARHPEQALTAIPSLDPAEQEYWQQMVWAITNSLDDQEHLSPRDRAAQSISPVNMALRRLREQADLSIRNSAFCEEISYFGNYKRFPREEFVPGQPVLLYAELENFRSEPTQNGEYRTLLRSLIEILGPNGQIRWKKTFAATEDLCRNPRRDYFHNYQFTIPERLPLGPHTLKLTVVDELSGKEATCSLRFTVK